MLFKLYVFLLFSTGTLAAISCLLFNKKNNELFKKSIVIWFIIRLLGDIISYILKVKLNLNLYPVFHFSILIEGMLMINYFQSMKRMYTKRSYYLYLIPIIAFIIDVLFLGSFIESPRLGYFFYYLLCSGLFFILLKSSIKIDQFNFIIIKVLFVYHSVLFCYSLFENIIRKDTVLMPLIYPFFLLFVISLNLFFSYFLWSRRKLKIH
ncbi:MAG: hypothetical protein RIQ59_1467 [Bacteroidota bacterium]|jgi:hypothetical protein